MSHVRPEHFRPSFPSQYSADEKVCVNGVGELQVTDTHGEKGRGHGHSSGFGPESQEAPGYKRSPKHSQHSCQT